MNPFCCASVDDIIEPGGKGDPIIDGNGEENVEEDQSEKGEDSDALSELAEKIVEDIFSKTASPAERRRGNLEPLLDATRQDGTFAELVVVTSGSALPEPELEVTVETRDEDHNSPDIGSSAGSLQDKLEEDFTTEAHEKLAIIAEGDGSDQGSDLVLQARRDELQEEVPTEVDGSDLEQEQDGYVEVVCEEADPAPNLEAVAESDIQSGDENDDFFNAAARLDEEDSARYEVMERLGKECSPDGEQSEKSPRQSEKSPVQSEKSSQQSEKSSQRSEKSSQQSETSPARVATEAPAEEFLAPESAVDSQIFDDSGNVSGSEEDFDVAELSNFADMAPDEEDDAAIAQEPTTLGSDIRDAADLALEVRQLPEKSPHQLPNSPADFTAIGNQVKSFLIFSSKPEAQVFKPHDSSDRRYSVYTSEISSSLVRLPLRHQSYKKSTRGHPPQRENEG